jgi:hypothetical protein
MIARLLTKLLVAVVIKALRAFGPEGRTLGSGWSNSATAQRCQRNPALRHGAAAWAYRLNNAPRRCHLGESVACTLGLVCFCESKASPREEV